MYLESGDNLVEDGEKSIRRGRKVRERNGVHSREKGKEQVEEVRVITRAKGSFASFEFFPRERFQEVGEKCGGRYVLECVNQGFVVV